jgi:hypothetical protein
MRFCTSPTSWKRLGTLRTLTRRRVVVRRVLLVQSVRELRVRLAVRAVVRAGAKVGAKVVDVDGAMVAMVGRARRRVRLGSVLR